MRRAVLVAGLSLGLASCGGGAPKGPPRDQALDLSLSAGDQAMSLDRPAEAARDYRDAYRHALARDDADAIATAGTDLVIALTAAGQPAAGLPAAGQARDDLARRHATVPFDLDLAQSAALLRLDRPSEAAVLAERAENAPTPEIAARGAFLRGLAADRLGDVSVLATSVARLGQGGKVSLTWQADRAELAARLALAQARPEAALDLALEAARSRRLSLDYRGMRRALRLASLAAQRAGDLARSAQLAEQANQSATSR